MTYALCKLVRNKLAEMMDHAIMGKKLLKIKTKPKTCEYLCGINSMFAYLLIHLLTLHPNSSPLFPSQNLPYMNLPP